MVRWVASSLLFAGCGAWASTASDIEAIVAERIDAAGRGDKVTWRKHVADDAVWIGPGLANGTTADAELAITANASLPKQSSEIREFEVREFGDIALATYVLLGSPPGDAAATKRFRKSDTYVRRDGGWQLVSAVEILVPMQAAAEADPARYDALAGLYRLDDAHVVRVWRDGRRLLSQAEGEKQPTELIPTARDAFVVDGDPGEYVFGDGRERIVDRMVFRLTGSPDVVLLREPAPLVGTWRLVSYEDKPPSGAAVFPYGPEPKGLLMYDDSGHMSIQLMKRPHPGVASGDDSRVTPEEKQALYDAYVAYFGTYTVDAARGVVIHHVEADLADVFIGNDEERPFVLRGDKLVISPRWKQDGGEWHGTRVFERVY